MSFGHHFDERICEQKGVQSVGMQCSCWQPLHGHPSQIQNASASSSAHAGAVIVQGVRAQLHNLQRWLAYSRASLARCDCSVMGRYEAHLTVDSKLLKLLQEADAFIKPEQACSKKLFDARNQ